MRTLIRLLAVLALVAGVIGFLVNRSGRTDPPDPACPPGTEPCSGVEDDAARRGEETGTGPQEESLVAADGFRVDSLDASRVCPGAGYLCAGFEDRGSWRVVRWNEATPVIRIRIPRPPVEDPALARSLQSAAARGIRTWHGHPFPLRVDLSNRPGTHDVTIRWTLVPGGRELGHARTRWRRSGDEATITVDDFALAVRNPMDPARALSPEQVELTAAHEMGHTLGLPHSDREDDVMYPSNTATRLTARDFRTMDALYRLDNGAAIVKP